MENVTFYFYFFIFFLKFKGYNQYSCSLANDSAERRLDETLTILICSYLLWPSEQICDQWEHYLLGDFQRFSLKVYFKKNTELFVTKLREKKCIEKIWSLGGQLLEKDLAHNSSLLQVGAPLGAGLPRSPSLYYFKYRIAFLTII